MAAKTLREILETPTPVVPFIAKPVLPRVGTMLLLANEKTFKSMLAINLGYDLAEGKPLFGRWKVVSPQTVLYIEQEIGISELKEERLAKIHSIRAGVLAEDNWWGISKDLTINLDTTEGFKNLMKEMDRVKPDVLILDPVREFHSQEENSSTEMKKMFDPLKKELNERRTALILVHHNRKPSEFSDSSAAANGRGSNYLQQMANTIVNLDRPIKSKNEVIRLSFTLRSDKPPDPFYLTFDEETGSFKERRVETRAV